MAEPWRRRPAFARARRVAGVGGRALQIDPVLLASFALLWLAIVPTPGPNTLLIVHLAVTARWRDVALALGGNLLAMAFYALATLQGLAVLLAAAPSVRLAIYLLGGAYLVWIGVRLVQLGFARRAEASNNATIGGNPDTKAQRPFVQGILTGLANVQALLCWLRAWPPALPPWASSWRSTAATSAFLPGCCSASACARSTRATARRWRSCSACCSCSSARGSPCGSLRGGCGHRPKVPCSSLAGHVNAAPRAREAPRLQRVRGQVWPSTHTVASPLKFGCER